MRFIDDRHALLQRRKDADVVVWMAIDVGYHALTMVVELFKARVFCEFPYLARRRSHIGEVPGWPPFDGRQVKPEHAERAVNVGDAVVIGVVPHGHAIVAHQKGRVSTRVPCDVVHRGIASGHELDVEGSVACIVSGEKTGVAVHAAHEHVHAIGRDFSRRDAEVALSEGTGIVQLDAADHFCRSGGRHHQQNEGNRQPSCTAHGKRSRPRIKTSPMVRP